LFVLLWTLALSATILWGSVTELWRPVLFVTGAGLLICLAVIAAWVRFGRLMVPVSALVAVPAYIAWKIPLYLGFLFSRRSEWTFREREKIDR
jgi:hypothetical protein